MDQTITITMGEIIKWIVALAGGIVTVTAAINAISKALTPYKSIKKQADRHTELLDKDNRRITDCETANTHICRAILALIDHELTGNSDDRLRVAKDDLQKYLTER